jgi:hypothetical protein
MEFTRYVLLSYEVVVGANREGNLRENTKQALARLFSLTDPNASLTQEEMKYVKVFSADQSRNRGFFKTLILIPYEDLDRVSRALGEVWDPDFIIARDLYIDLKEEPALVPPVPEQPS